MKPDELIEFYCVILKSRLGQRMKGDIFKMVIREIDTSVEIWKKDLEEMKKMSKELKAKKDETTN